MRLAKRFMLLPALALVGLGLATSADWASRPHSNDEHEAMEVLNLIRSRAGAPVLQRNGRLDLAARRQAQHMAITGEIDHFRKTNTGLFGIQGTPYGRRLAALYSGTGAESLARSFSMEPEEAVKSQLHAPYHRITILDPAAQQLGIGLVPHEMLSFGVLDAAIELGGYATPPADTVVVWPAHNEVNIPAIFLPGTETPNPAPGYKTVGYPVTVQAGLGNVLTTNHFVVKKRSTGEVVEGKLLTSNNDENMPEQAVAFIPVTPLEWGTEYAVEFKGSSAGRAVERSWEFYTADVPKYELAVSTMDKETGSLNLKITSPVQPAILCYKASPGTKMDLTWVGPFKVKASVQNCQSSSCAVQLYLSDNKTCEESKARVNAIFGTPSPGKPAQLLDYA